MAWPRFRNPIQKLIVPTADLGLQELDFSALEFPGDVPLVVALQLIQTPAGPRVVQGQNSGGSARAPTTNTVFAPSATQAAGSSAVFNPNGYQGTVIWVWVQALNGAPTNIIYTLDISLDNGVTWFKVLTMAAVTATGIVVIGCGGVASAGVAGDVKASGTFNSVMPDLARVSWTFTGGAAPTVQHTLYRSTF